MTANVRGDYRILLYKIRIKFNKLHKFNFIKNLFLSIYINFCIIKLDL